MVNKKIVLFIDSLVAGGAQRQIVLLAEKLHKRGHDIVVLNYLYDEQLLGMLTSEGIRREVILKSSKLDLNYLYHLYKFFKVEKPDVIISYLNTPNLWARLIGKAAGVKHIITSERNNDLDKSKIRLFIEKQLHPFSNTIVVNAFSIKDLLVANGVPEKKIKVIYNGIDTNYFSKVTDSERQIFRKSLNVQDDILITLPGRMTIQKNHICLLKAFSVIRKKYSNIKLLFVGNEFDASIKFQLKELIKKNNLQEFVIFYGPSDEMPLIYSSSDIVVLPSLWEGLPNVVIEAMSCSVPVIASDISDNSKLIENNINGYVVKWNDHIDLGDKIIKLANKPQMERDAMGNNSKEKIEKLCSINSFIKEYENVICK